MVRTWSSKATMESRSWAVRKEANRAAASLAAASGAPDMEPDRSSTRATLMGGRLTRASPARVTSMPTWWAFWVVRNRVDRRMSAFMRSPGDLLLGRGPVAVEGDYADAAPEVEDPSGGTTHRVAIDAAGMVQVLGVEIELNRVSVDGPVYHRAVDPSAGRLATGLARERSGTVSAGERRPTLCQR